jgi:ribosomal protein S18 acetylase RimI-like enzyme
MPKQEPKSQPISIELAVPQDAEAIAELLRRTWMATYPSVEAGITEEDIRLRTEGRNGERIQPSIDKWRQKIKENNDSGAVYVARLDGEVVGVARPSIIDGKRYVGAMYVSPEEQKRGIGSMLMQTILEWHGTQDDIYLNVASYNRNAIYFYKRYGFEITDTPVADEGNVYGNTRIPEIEMILRAEPE